MFKIRTYLLNARPKTFNPLSRLSRHSACRHGCRVQAACTIHIYVMCESAMCKIFLQKQISGDFGQRITDANIKVKPKQLRPNVRASYTFDTFHDGVSRVLRGWHICTNSPAIFWAKKNARASHSGPVCFYLQFNENILCGPVCVVKVYERMRWFLIKFFDNQMCGQRTNYKNVGFLWFFDTFNWIKFKVIFILNLKKIGYNNNLKRDL